MNRPTNNRISRAPSPSVRQVRHSSLTIRTMNPPSQPSVPKTPTSPPPPQSYPIPIPPEKFQKALKLYNTYRLEQALAESRQSATSYHDPFHLDVPGHFNSTQATTQSITSYASSRHRAASITTSNYDGITDISSVVSFDENESPSVKARAQGELLSFDGKVVKQRARKRLNPVARAKAALVRCLGSCRICRSRRVPCPLDHHDIQSLDAQVRASQLRTQIAPPQQHRQSHSSHSSSSQMTARSVSGSHQPAPAGGSQTDALLGIGGNEQLLEDFGNFDGDASLDIQLTGGTGGPYSNIQLPAPASYSAPPDPQTHDPSALEQDPQMLKLGLQDGEFFYCRYFRHEILGGLCNQLCVDAEQLQVHFEYAHGAFTRLPFPFRYICSVCDTWNYGSGVCTGCRRDGVIQVWVFGRSIREVSYQRQAPDGMDFPPFNSSSAPYNPSYGGSNMDSPWGAPGAGQGNYNGGGNFGYGFQGGGGSNYGAYGGPGNGYGYDPSNDLNLSGSQFQGSNFRTASQLVQKSPVIVGIFLSTARQRWQRQKLLLLFLILLVAITFSFTHDWIFSKLLMAAPKAAAGIRSHMPEMGLGVVIAGFGVGLSVRSWRVRRAQCRPRCPLYVLSSTSLPFDYRQTAAYMTGVAYS